MYASSEPEPVYLHSLKILPPVPWEQAKLVEDATLLDGSLVIPAKISLQPDPKHVWESPDKLSIAYPITATSRHRCEPRQAQRNPLADP